MRSTVALCLLLAALAAQAQAQDLDARVERLAQELRCVVCQSQSVAESNAPLAVDMKRHLRQGLAAGRSEAELRDELVQRYGEQVLYRPALHAGTAPLWFGPLALLVVGLLVYLRQGRRDGQPLVQSRPAERGQARPVPRGDGDACGIEPQAHRQRGPAWERPGARPAKSLHRGTDNAD